MVLTAIAVDDDILPRVISTTLPAMVEGEGACEMLEHIIIWGERRGGQHRAEDGVGRVVKRVARHQGACNISISRYLTLVKCIIKYIATTQI